MLEAHYINFTALPLYPRNSELKATQAASEDAVRSQRPVYVYKLVAVVHPPVPAVAGIEYVSEESAFKSAAEVHKEWTDWFNTQPIAGRDEMTNALYAGRYHEALARQRGSYR